MLHGLEFNVHSNSYAVHCSTWRLHMATLHGDSTRRCCMASKMPSIVTVTICPYGTLHACVSIEWTRSVHRMNAKYSKHLNVMYAIKLLNNSEKRKRRGCCNVGNRQGKAIDIQMMWYLVHYVINWRKDKNTFWRINRLYDIHFGICCSTLDAIRCRELSK